MVKRGERLTKRKEGPNGAFFHTKNGILRVRMTCQQTDRQKEMRRQKSAYKQTDRQYDGRTDGRTDKLKSQTKSTEDVKRERTDK